jgi:hypothetical protein
MIVDAMAGVGDSDVGRTALSAASGLDEAELQRRATAAFLTDVTQAGTAGAKRPRMPLQMDLGVSVVLGDKDGRLRDAIERRDASALAAILAAAPYNLPAAEIRAALADLDGDW